MSKRQSVVEPGGAMRSRLGFTLVEMGIVIGVIGVLMAIAVPSYKKARTASMAKRAEGDLQILATAIREMSWDTGRWPNTWLKTTSVNSNPPETMNLSVAGAGLLLASSTYSNWKGPYCRRIPLDPWGQRYYFDQDYLLNGVYRIVVASGGPNKSGQNVYDSDNIYIILQ